jgi:RNase P protein component
LLKDKNVKIIIFVKKEIKKSNFWELKGILKNIFKEILDNKNPNII